MFFAAANKVNQLLYVSYVGRVRAEELRAGLAEVTTLLATLEPGFRLLADFTHVEIIDPECMAEIGHVMELLEQKGVGTVVRVVPDPRLDPGMNILAVFHYTKPPRVVTSDNFQAAIKILSQ